MSSTSFDQYRSWLSLLPQISSGIVWETRTGELHFDDWNEDQKNDLFAAIEITEVGGTVVPEDPLPNARSLSDGDFPATVLQDSHAWKLFLSHLANGLNLERNGLLPWSILDYPAEVRGRLLTSLTLFRFRPDFGGYLVWQHGWTLPAPADKTFTFLKNNALIGETRLDTIGRVLEWCRQNLRHFSGPVQTGNFESIWGYRGFPPVSTFLGSGPHSTAGCHGTNGLLQDLLRAVNIPVDYSVGDRTGHALPRFVSEGRFLSHADDLYSQYSRGNPPPFPALSLLIDQATYDSWFVSPPISERNKNIGRQVYELALIHLPPKLLKDYRADVASGKSHEGGAVAATFSQWYTVSDLENMDLWGRMDAKLALTDA